MWIKIVSCLTLVVILNCDTCICTDVKHIPSRDVNISSNITIYKNRYARLLGLLSFLKGFHHAKHIYHPLILSKLWRASFEFELKPNSISQHEISGTYFPAHVGQSNSGLSSNGIESIFHFGNNEQQSSVTIGGSNQIVKGPDERDEIANDVSHNNQIGIKGTIDSVVPAPPEEVNKVERVLRHAIQARADEHVEEDENNSNSAADTTGTVTVDSTTPEAQSLTTPQTQPVTTPQITFPAETTVPETISIMESQKVTTMKPETASTISNNEQGSSVPIPSEWMGYYDYGINKPEFIKDIEFTTNYPSQLVSEDIRYFEYEKPFRPSLPDYSNTYYSNFFVPLRYVKR